MIPIGVPLADGFSFLFYDVNGSKVNLNKMLDV